MAAVLQEGSKGVHAREPDINVFLCVNMFVPSVVGVWHAMTGAALQGPHIY